MNTTLRRPAVWGLGTLMVVATTVATTIAPSIAWAQAPTPTPQPNRQAEPADDPAGDVVTWGSRPADQAGQQRSAIEATADPGTTVDDEIVVTNYNDAPLSLAVYASDAYTALDGTINARLRDESVDGAASWIELGVDEVVVPANQSIEVPFSLAVPNDAEPGEHGAVILTSLVTEDNGVAVDRRLGTRVELRVSGDIEMSVAIENITMDMSESLSPVGQRTIDMTYQIVNTGNVRVAAAVDIDLADMVGRDIGTWVDIAEVPEIRPGDRVELATTLKSAAAPLLRVDAQISIDATATAAEGNPTTTADATSRNWTIIWPGVLALLVMAAAMWWWRRRHRRRRHRSAPDQTAHTPPNHPSGRHEPVDSYTLPRTGRSDLRDESTDRTQFAEKSVLGPP